MTGPVNYRNGAGYDQATRDTVSEMIANGVHWEKICQYTGVSRTYVFRLRRAYQARHAVTVDSSEVRTNALKKLDEAYARFDREQSPKTLVALNVARLKYDEVKHK